MEATATKLFNTDTAKLYYDEVNRNLNLVGKGAKINSDYLSNLAQRDLPMAVELLSKLTVSGQISQKTLTKMLSIWHSPFLSNVLFQINGDLDKYTSTMSESRKVSTDYELQMKSLSNSLEVFKNNIQSVTVGLLDMSRTGLNVLNNVLLPMTKISRSNYTKETAGIGSFLGGIMTAFLGIITLKGVLSQALKFVGITKAVKDIMALEKSVTMLTTTTKFLQKTGGIFGTLLTKTNLWGLGLSLVLSTVMGIALHFERINREQDDLIDKMNRDRDNFINTNKDLDRTRGTLRGYKAELESILSQNISDMFKDNYQFIDESNESASKLSGQLEKIVKISKQVETSFKNFTDNINVPNFKNIPNKVDISKNYLEYMNKNNEKQISAPINKNFMQYQKEVYKEAYNTTSNYYDSVEFWNREDISGKQEQIKALNMILNGTLKLKNANEAIAKSNKVDLYTRTLGLSEFAVKLDEIGRLVDVGKIRPKGLIEDTISLELNLRTAIKQATLAQEKFVEEDYANLLNQIRDVNNAMNEISQSIQETKLRLQKDIFGLTMNKSSIESVAQLKDELGKLKINTSFLDDYEKIANKQIKDPKKQFEALKDSSVLTAVQDLESQKRQLNIFNTQLDTKKSEYDINKKLLKSNQELDVQQKKSLEFDIKVYEDTVKQADAQNENVKSAEQKLILTLQNYDTSQKQTKEYEIQRNLLSDIVRETQQAYKEFQYQGNIEFFNIKDTGIKDTFKRQRDEINLELSKLGTSSASTQYIKEIMKSILPDGKDISSVLDTATVKQYEAFSKTLDLREELISLDIKEKQAIEENGRAKVEWEKSYNSVLKDANQINNTRLQQLQRELEDAKSLTVNTNDTMKQAEKDLAVKKASKAIDDEKRNILREYLSSQVEIDTFNMKTLAKLEHEKNLLEDNLTTLKKQNATELETETILNKIRLINLQIEKQKSEEDESLKNITQDYLKLNASNEELAQLELKALPEKDTTYMSIIEKKKLEYDISKKILDIQTETLNTIISSVDAFAKGDVKAPSFDTKNLLAGLSEGIRLFDSVFMQHKKFKEKYGAEAKLGANITPQQIGAMLQFGITQFNNIYQRINQAEVTKINNEIETLEMRKSLATNEIELRQMEQDILNKRIELIRKEASGKATQSVLGGVSSGIQSGLGVASALGLTNPLAIGAGLAVGLIDVLGGVFGASEQQKQVEIQEKQLREQERIRILTENQNLLMQNQSRFFQTWLKFSFSGIEKGFNEAFKQEGFVAGTKSTAYGTGTKLGTYQEFKTVLEGYKTASADAEKAMQENYMEELAGGSRILSNQSRINYLENKKYLTLEEQDELASLKRREEKAINYHDAKRRKELYDKNIAEMEEADRGYIEQRKTLYSTYFDWEVEQITQAKLDEEKKLGKITDAEYEERVKKVGQYEQATWKKREDIMNKYLENVKEGINDLEAYMGDYVTSSIMSAFTRNQTGINKILDSIEVNINALSKYMSANIGKDIKDLFPIFTKTGNYNPILSPLIQNFKDMAKEQDYINEQAKELTKTWIALGGKLSDIKSQMSELQQGLYDAVQQGIQKDNFLDASRDIGKFVGEQIGNSLAENLMNNKIQNKFLELSSLVDNIIKDSSERGVINFGNIIQSANQIRTTMAQVEAERQKLKAVRDIFNMDTNVEYKSASNDIQYQTGTTSNQTFNYYNTVKVDVGNFFGDNEESMYDLANLLAPALEQVAIKR